MEIENAIYQTIPPKTHSVTMMMGIINSLAEGDKTKLKDLSTKLLEYRKTYNFTVDQLDEAFCTLTDYLHKTYLQELRMGIVPAAALPETSQRPSSEAITRRVSSKLD